MWAGEKFAFACSFSSFTVLVMILLLWPQPTSGGKVWLQFALSGHTINRGKSRQQLQEPGTWKWSRAHGGTLLTGLLLVAGWACFPSTQDCWLLGGTAYGELHPSTAIINQENGPIGLLTGLSGRQIFSIKFPSSKTALACVKII